MTLEVKISKKLVPYKTAFSFLKKRVELVKNLKVRISVDIRTSINFYRWNKI